MYCGSCGSKIPDGAVFCSKCGARVIGSTPSSVGEESARNVFAGTRKVGVVSDAALPKRKSTPIKIILLASCFALLLTLVVFVANMLLAKGDVTDPPSSSEDIAVGSHASNTNRESVGGQTQASGTDFSARYDTFLKQCSYDDFIASLTADYPGITYEQASQIFPENLYYDYSACLLINQLYNETGRSAPDSVTNLLASYDEAIVEAIDLNTKLVDFEILDAEYNSEDETWLMKGQIRNNTNVDIYVSEFLFTADTCYQPRDKHGDSSDVVENTIPIDIGTVLGTGVEVESVHTYVLDEFAPKRSNALVVYDLLANEKRDVSFHFKVSGERIDDGVVKLGDFAASKECSDFFWVNDFAVDGASLEEVGGSNNYMASADKRSLAMHKYIMAASSVGDEELMSGVPVSDIAKEKHVYLDPRWLYKAEVLDKVLRDATISMCHDQILWQIDKLKINDNGLIIGIESSVTNNTGCYLSQVAIGSNKFLVTLNDGAKAHGDRQEIIVANSDNLADKAFTSQTLGPMSPEQTVRFDEDVLISVLGYNYSVIQKSIEFDVPAGLYTPEELGVDCRPVIVNCTIDSQKNTDVGLFPSDWSSRIPYGKEANLDVNYCPTRYWLLDATYWYRWRGEWLFEHYKDVEKEGDPVKVREAMEAFSSIPADVAEVTKTYQSANENGFYLVTHAEDGNHYACNR